MNDVTRIIFACDESGAKGYADTDEQFPGQVGVYVGIILPETHLAEKMPLFEAVKAKYVGPDGKLHITDLPPERQQSLRDDVFEAIRQSRLPCLWYAVHVAGFHEWFQRNQQLQAEARAARRSDIKLGSPRPNPQSLHEELFAGLYSHLVAFCEERGKHDLEVEIRLDRVDAPIVKNFEVAARKLLGLDEESAKKVTGFDPSTQSVVTGEVRTKFTLPPELEVKVVVRSLELNVIEDDDALVLAADVLVNSLAYLFHNRPPEEQFGPLNRPEAVAAHPLALQLDSFNNWGNGDVVGDALYQHPKAKK